MASENVPLAIVGIGSLFPKADGPGAFWANIKQGVDCVGPVPPTHWKPEDYFDADPKSPDMTYAARGAFLDPVDFNPLEFGISPVDLEATDTSQLLGLVAARQALNDAGYTPDRKYDKNRISVILGVTGTLELVIPLGARLGHPKWRNALAAAGVDKETADRVVADISGSYVPWQENSFPGLLGNVVAGRIANKLDLGGTNCVVDAACASSLSAIHLASLELAAGRCDVAVTGGVDTFNDIFMYMCFSKTPALSKTGDAKPFDADSDGTILGEGLGIIVLKRLADAERDGDRIYAVLKTIGSSSDGKGNAVYAPSASGQVRALQNAYELADVSPATIELIEAHGTGTRVGDSVEATALTEVFRQAKPDGTWCALGSVKSMVGHTKAAAGAAGVIKAALALYNKVLPPTIKVKKPVDPLQPGKSPLYINTEKRPWLSRPDHPRRAGMSAFGFGGSNFHAVLEEHRPEKAGPDWDGRVQIIAVSGASITQVLDQISKWPIDEPWGAICIRAAESRATFDYRASARLMLVAQRDGDNAKLIAAAKAKLQAEPSARFWALPDGAYFGQGSAAGTVGVLFPGQGSQSVGMLRDLACTFPEMLDSLTDAEVGWTRTKRLVDFVYPHSAFTSDARADQETALRSTDVAQSALGAVNIGAWAVIRRFGLQASAFAGHSYGELVALCAAGAFDTRALHQISRVRGRLMASLATENAGAMLAVHASGKEVDEILHDDKLDVIVANRNSPTQAILSGATAEIARAENSFQRRRLRTTRLPVAAAFHSRLVSRAQGPFREALEIVPFSRSTVPVFANNTARQYPHNPQEARDLLAGQLAQPVEFVRQIENMAEYGVRTFLEIGPGSVLTRLTESILQARPTLLDWDCVALDPSNGKKSGLFDLAKLLARLAARGHAIDLTAWEAGQTYSVPLARPGLTVPIVGANYVRPKPPNANLPTLSRPAKPELLPVKAMVASQRMEMNENSTNPRPDPSAVSNALAITQQSLLAFQKMQEDTARLHKQFLDNQHAALATLQTLVAQQHAILTGQPVPTLAITAPAAPVATPAPVSPPIVVSQAAPTRSQAPVIVAASPPPAPVATPISAPKDSSSILLAVVAEKTGYPADMLGLDMALDADLGIDSIKRVEILSALQEKLPNAPAVKPEHLGALHTLRDIVNFLGGPAAETTTTPVAIEMQQPKKERLDLSEVLLAVVAEKTGYPADMLGLDMALDADLGIDSIKRVEILSALQEKVPDAPEVKPEHLGTLHTLRDIAQFLDGGGGHSEPIAPVQETPRPFDPALTPGSAESERSTAEVVRSVVRPVALELQSRPRVRIATRAPVWLIADPSSLATQIAERLAAAGCQTRPFTWNDVPNEQDPAGVAGLILIAPSEKVAADLPLRAFRWLRRTAAALTDSAVAGGALFATISNLGGTFGFDGLDPRIDPVQGALAGLAKTAAHEWPLVSCKAIDIDPNLGNGIADQLVDELLTIGPTEVGLTAKGRIGLELIEASVAGPNDKSHLLASGDVVVVTGGARGVTAESLFPFVRAYQLKLILLGRTDVASAEPNWLAQLEDEAAIKKAIIAHGGRAMTPREVGEEFRRIVAQREIRRNVRRLTAAGASVEYLPTDVQNAQSLADTLADIRRRLGPITALIHGAGVLADRKIEDLTDEQFQLVYSTKVDGVHNLLAATENDPLKAIVLFSSSTGRFGRTGQAAYAAANEVLNKTAQRLARSKPTCRTVAFNWGPWDGGMVTPALVQVFAKEGIGLISYAEGGATLWRELTAKDGPAEVVVLARSDLGATTEAEPQATASDLRLVFERAVRLQDHPFLYSHIIGDRAVLPLVLHLEWMAHAAMHGNPGLKFHGFNDLRIFQGVHVEEATPATLRVQSGKAARREGLFVVPVEIRGSRKGREITHSRAEIVLSEQLPDTPEVSETLNSVSWPCTVDEIYDDILFHGPDLRAFERIEAMSDEGAAAWSHVAPMPSEWLTNPMRGAWLADPLALDAAFQLLSVWSYQKHRAVSLPCFAGSYRQYRRSFPADGVSIGVRVTQDNGATARADVEFVDLDGNLVARLTDVEHVIDSSLNDTFRRGRLASAAHSADIGS